MALRQWHRYDVAFYIEAKEFLHSNSLA
jgi:hypothetical protein